MKFQGLQLPPLSLDSLLVLGPPGFLGIVLLDPPLTIVMIFPCISFNAFNAFALILFRCEDS